MAKANVDPDELLRFAKDLTRFNHEMRGLMQSLKGKMRALETSWQDQEQRKFSEEFDQTVRTLGNFLEAADRHSQFLAKKASFIHDYLNQR
jgi:uncharacterized protein YukE